MLTDTDIDVAPVEQPEAKTHLDVLREAIRSAPEAGDDGDDGQAEDSAGAESDESAAPGGDGADADPAVADGATEKPVVAEDDIYKMPDGLQAKSQERFRALAEKSKSLSAQIQERDGQISQMREATEWLRQEVFTDDDAPADLVQFASYRKALKSGDFETAGKLLQAQAQQLALASGKPIAIDPLADFSDLRQRVDGMELAESDAIELARSRQQQHVQQQHAQRQQQAAEQHESYRHQAETAVQQVDAMCAEWKAKDIDWPAKEKILMEQMPQIMQSYPPHMIPAQIRLVYESVSRVMPAQQQQRAPSPLRGSGRAAGAAAPASALDAMRQKLGYT